MALWMGTSVLNSRRNNLQGEGGEKTRLFEWRLELEGKEPFETETWENLVLGGVDLGRVRAKIDVDLPATVAAAIFVQP